MAENLAQRGEPILLSAPDEFTTRPIITGRRGVVAAGHYLAAEAGMHILRQGGNAIDATVAMGFCSGVLEPGLVGIGGESPILIYHARTKRVVAINGQGVAPKAATIDWFRHRGIELIPGDGLLPATVPSQPDNWITALNQFGTLSLEAVLTPAIELAHEGFAVYGKLRRTIEDSAERFTHEWPASREIYMPEGRVPNWGDRHRNLPWANTFKTLIEAEQANAHRGRQAALDSARNVFYSGWIAERIADFCRNSKVQDATGSENCGLLTFEDLAAYHAQIEEPLSIDYHGLDVYKCRSWTQGPVFLQQLRLLEGFDLHALGHNTTEYLHTWIECAKLAFADREYFYGDPEFVNVPMSRLLSKQYASDRRRLIDAERASMALRPGDADEIGPRPMKLILGNERSYDGDTTHVCAIDAEGNMIAATPSGGWIQSSPVIPELGFPLGTRGQMFSLDPKHPNALEPKKRPRSTLTPSLVMKDSQPWMVFGTPGGDQQDQWTLQFFLNLVHFDMNVQQAIDAPTVHSQHFPSSFYPRAQHPGRMVVEQRIDEAVRDQLKRRGHDVLVTGPWSNGRVLGIRIDPDRGLIFGGASPRGETGYAIGW